MVWTLVNNNMRGKATRAEKKEKGNAGVNMTICGDSWQPMDSILWEKLSISSNYLTIVWNLLNLFSSV